jgi:hypothetical protein
VFFQIGDNSKAILPCGCALKWCLGGIDGRCCGGGPVL